MHGVVEVVAPLAGQPVAARLTGGDQPGIVGVGLGDQDQFAVQQRREGQDLAREFLQEVQRAVVFQRVHGVQPQAVQVESRSHISALPMRKARTSSDPGWSRLTAGPHGVTCAVVKYGPTC